MKKLKPSDLKGFTANEHEPYTDYNQEIIDGLKDNAEVSDSINGKRKYIFTQVDNFYTHNTCFKTDKYYTNVQFMELIGMTKPSSTAFTKADLKDGMVCTTRNGNVYAVKGDRMYRDGGMYIQLDDVDDDLTALDKAINQLDIIKVVSPVVVFERVDLKQQAIKKELEFAEAKKLRLENHINVLKSKLK